MKTEGIRRLTPISDTLSPTKINYLVSYTATKQTNYKTNTVTIIYYSTIKLQQT